MDYPSRFLGWSVCRHPDRGYIKMYRRLNSKVRKSIYIGKVWDEEKAINRIKEKEAEVYERS